MWLATNKIEDAIVQEAISSWNKFYLAYDRYPSFWETIDNSVEEIKRVMKDHKHPIDKSHYDLDKIGRLFGQRVSIKV